VSRWVADLPGEVVGASGVTETAAEQAVEFFGDEIRNLAGVDGVFLLAPEDGRVGLWTVLDDGTREIEDAVYAAESRMMDAHPDARVEFRIVYRHGRPLEQVLPAVAERIV
jgi:hypothetical protein